MKILLPNLHVLPILLFLKFKIYQGRNDFYLKHFEVVIIAFRVTFLFCLILSQNLKNIAIIDLFVNFLLHLVFLLHLIIVVSLLFQKQTLRHLRNFRWNWLVSINEFQRFLSWFRKQFEVILCQFQYSCIHCKTL